MRLQGGARLVGLPRRSLPGPERVAQALRKKRRGNTLYSRGKFDDAARAFRKGIEYTLRTTADPPGIPKLEASEKEVGFAKVTDKDAAQLDAICAALWNNLAAVHSKGDTAAASAAVLDSCREVLKLQPSNVKALYRMSKVLFAKQEFDDARSCMTKALSAEPDNDACRKLHAKILVQRDASLASEKEIYKRMLSGNRSSTGGGGGGGGGGDGGEIGTLGSLIMQCSDGLRKAWHDAAWMLLPFWVACISGLIMVCDRNVAPTPVFDDTTVVLISIALAVVGILATPWIPPWMPPTACFCVAGISVLIVVCDLIAAAPTPMFDDTTVVLISIALAVVGILATRTFQRCTFGSMEELLLLSLFVVLVVLVLVLVLMLVLGKGRGLAVAVLLLALTYLKKDGTSASTGIQK